MQQANKASNFDVVSGQNNKNWPTEESRLYSILLEAIKEGVQKDLLSTDILVDLTSSGRSL